MAQAYVKALYPEEAQDEAAAEASGGSCLRRNPAPNPAMLAKCLRNSGGVQGRNRVLCTAGGPGGPSLFGMPAASSDLQEMT